jgi:hypothetical protein
LFVFEILVYAFLYQLGIIFRHQDIIKDIGGQIILIQLILKHFFIIAIKVLIILNLKHIFSHHFYHQSSSILGNQRPIKIKLLKIYFAIILFKIFSN